MEQNKYSDPENWENIKDKIKTAPTLGDVKKILDNTFPGLIVAFLKRYSHDYPSFTENWIKITGKIKTTPKEIMILDNFIFDDNHNLVKLFCECFTRAGFSVRRKMEFIPCKHCEYAIPAEPLYNILKENNITVPESYSLICTSCSPPTVD